MRKIEPTFSNPYESPTSASGAIAEVPRASLVRGIVWAVPYSLLGFAIPYFVLGVLILLKAFEWDWESWLWGSGPPAVGCAIMFANGALIRFAPAKRAGFVRSLMLAGLVLLGTLPISYYLSCWLGIDQRNYTDPTIMARCTLYIVVAIASGCGVAGLIIYRQRRTDAPTVGEPNTPN